MNPYLSVDAKAFVPKTTEKLLHPSLHSTLSADVPAFVPAHDRDDGKKNVSMPVQRGRFHRHDHDWFDTKTLLSVQKSLPPNLQKNTDIDSTKKKKKRKVQTTSTDCPQNKALVKPKVALSFSLEHTRFQGEKTTPRKSLFKDSQFQEAETKSRMNEKKVVEDSGSQMKVEPPDQPKPPISWSSIVKKPAIMIKDDVKQRESVSTHNLSKECKNKTLYATSSGKIKQNKRATTLTIKNSGNRSSEGRLVETNRISEGRSNEPRRSSGGRLNEPNRSYGGRLSEPNRSSGGKLGDTKDKYSIGRSNNTTQDTSYEKRKLTRTTRSFSSSSNNEDNIPTNKKIEIEKLKQTANLLAVKDLIHSYKANIEQGKEEYKVTKVKHRLHQKTENLESAKKFATQEKEIRNKTESNYDGYSSKLFQSLPNNNASTPLMSYSAMLKKTPVKLPLELDSDVKRELTDEEKKTLIKRNKALKRKMKIKKKKEEYKAGREGVSKQPIQQPLKQSEKEMKLDISDMFDKLLIVPQKQVKSSQKQKKIAISTGVISVVPGLAKKNTLDGKRVGKNKYGGMQTILDGVNLIRKRGKERETPKKKKPTLLKKVIKAERERKRKILEKKEREKIILEEGIKKDKVEDERKNEEEVNEVEAIETEQKQIDRLSELPDDIWKKLHSRKFREYCNHVLTKDIDTLTYTLLKTLLKFQDRVYHENPMKFKQKRRFVLGLREVSKHLKLKKLKAVIIAPNLERISTEGGLDDYLSIILSLCKEYELPQIFAMSRHALGRTVKKTAPVSVIGIFNYDGAQDTFKQLMEHVRIARELYSKKVTALIESEYGHIPDISITVEEDLELNDNIVEIRSSSQVEADLLRQNILTKFSSSEFRIPRTEDDLLIKI